MADPLRSYTFLPWLRQGIAAGIKDDLDIEDSPQRASIAVTFRIGSEPPISKTAELLGPGDVVGINSRAIVKTEPRNWVTDFEANYLPYIEFYEEDFPWRFTPALPEDALVQSKLRPWIVLLVLTEEEFEDQSSGGPLPAIKIKDENPAKFFPVPDQTWAWAHVHISQDVVGNADQHTHNDAEVRGVEQQLETLMRANRDNASSRLLCSRKLKDNTAYHAFVVPAFETGRRAGLGLDPFEGISSRIMASWEGDDTDLYPVYYRWFFRTGTKGDFEFLVDQLTPRPVDKRVGVRDMDMQERNYETDGMTPPFDVLGLEGALKSPEMEPFPPQWPPPGTIFNTPDPGSPGKFLNDLETKVNLQFDLQEENTERDPIISPPLYGKWYAKADKLDVQTGNGWVHELNRDPRYRTPAGVGTQVIQKDQENLMQQAWSQLGDLLRANQKIRQLQLGMMSTFVMYQKNILPQTADELLTFTQPVQSRVLGSSTTIAKQVEESRLPTAALDPAFRKITRNRGAIMRKVAPDPRTETRPIATLLNEGTLTAAPPPPEPTGQLVINKVAEAVHPVDIPEFLRFLLQIHPIRRLLLMFPLFARLLTRIEIAQTFREESFTPEFVDTVPLRPNFVLTEFNEPLPNAGGGGNADSVEGANFRIALRDAYNAHQTLPPPPPFRDQININTTVEKLKVALNPSVTIPRRAEFILKIPAGIKNAYLLPQKTLVTVMAHPVFKQPMYGPLRDISSEFLCPNLELIPNNTISLMETNSRFIQAYMVGLNHEMACELLWREFPTDQRGSYFRQFWDVADVINRNPNKTQAQLEEELLDIKKLHEWTVTDPLGSFENRPLPPGGNKDESRVVLVVRGDLLKKYPTVVIYAQRAKWDEDEDGNDIRVLDQENPAQNVKDPIFKAEIEPDIRFLGFELTKVVAKGSADRAANDPGWFFVLQERPGEPRFGLDNLSGDPLGDPITWNDLAWEHLTGSEGLDVINLDDNAPDPNFVTDETDNNFAWNRNAADMAYILYQVPVMVAFHAADMLT